MFASPNAADSAGPLDASRRALDPGIGLLPFEWLAAGLAASCVAVAALMVKAHLTVTLTLDVRWFALLYIATAAGILYRCRTPQASWQHILRDAVEYVSLFVCICLLGALATYPAAAESSGFADASLAGFDRAVRFNWVAWYDFVAAHAYLQPIERLAYESIFVTPAFLLGYFACAGRKAEARRFIVTFWLASVITLSLFMCVPAEGPLAFLWHGHIPYMPESGLYEAALIPALRASQLHQVALGSLQGLVSAPSFHTVSAVLFIASAWPVRRLRWPVAFIDMAMLMATPVEGTHYLADMLAGVVVALASIILVAALARHCAPQAARERFR